MKSALRPLSGVALLLFTAMSVVAPAQIQHSDARTFSSGLKIKLDRSTPPFAALEDGFNDHIDARPKETFTKIVELGSATLSADKVIARIHRADEETQTIALKSVSRDDVLQTLFLPLVQSMQKTETPDVAPLGHFVARAPALAQPMTTASAGHGVVMPTTAPVSETAPAPSALLHQSSAEALTQSLSRAISGTIELTDGLALTSPTDQIIVYHEVEGAPEGAEGTVWIRDGRYKIQVDNLSGLLVAELRNAHGELLGRGELDLVDLPLQKSQQYRVGDVDLKLSPVAQGLSGQVISGNAYNEQRVAIPKAQVETANQNDLVTADAKGIFHNEQMSNDSTALVQASRAGYWKTIATAATDHMNTLVLLPKTFLKSMAQIVKTLRPLVQIDRRTAIVWGHVNLNGRAVAGAQVQLLTTTDPVEPVYFNEMMIPDPNLKATSSNGLYAFIPVAEGPHAIQATVAGHLSEPVAFPAQQQAVSSIDIEMTLSRRMTLKSFDAFEPSHPLSAAGAKLGSTRSIAIDASGLGFMRFAAGSSLMVMDVDAQAPYTPERFVLSRQKTYAYLPMVKADWLTALRGGVATAPGTAVVVGFVQGASTYHVMIDDDSAVSQAAETVVYFNAQGEMTRSGLGEPGGGFAIFNLQEGYRQISVMSDDSDRLSTSVVLADSHVVSVISHSTH